MAVPTTIADLSTTAASNSPAGTDVVGSTPDDFFRAHASIIREACGTVYTAGGSANALTITTVPAITAYFTGLRLKVKAASANTGTATLNVNSLGLKNITRDGAIGLVEGDILVDKALDLIYDGTHFQLLNPGGSPKAAAYRSAAQTIGSSTWTQVQQDAEEFDVGGYMEITGSYRYFPARAGKYLLIGQVAYQAASGTASIYAAIYKNGTSHRFANAGSASAAAARTVAVSCIVEANGTTDYFQLYTFQDQGGNMSIDTGATRTFLHATFLD